MCMYFRYFRLIVTSYTSVNMPCPCIIIIFHFSSINACILYTCILFHKFIHLLFSMSQSASDQRSTPKWYRTEKMEVLVISQKTRLYDHPASATTSPMGGRLSGCLRWYKKDRIQKILTYTFRNEYFRPAEKLAENVNFGQQDLMADFFTTAVRTGEAYAFLFSFEEHQLLFHSKSQNARNIRHQLKTVFELSEDLKPKLMQKKSVTKRKI